MTKTRPRQLELPVMVNVNGKITNGSETGRVVNVDSAPNTVPPGFHKPASSSDQSIYKAISDNYFESAVKRA